MLLLSPLALIPEVKQFFARADPLSGKRRNAYKVFIEGLVNAGLWSKFDRLYLFATDTSANARLSIIPVAGGTLADRPALPFTSDLGFSSEFIGGQTGLVFNTGFIPISAPSPRYTLDSAHLAVWFLHWNANTVGINVNSPIGSEGIMGNSELRPAAGQQIQYTLNNMTPAVTAALGSFAGNGLLIASRVSATQLTGYRDGVAVATSNAPTTGLSNRQIWIIQFNRLDGSGGAYPATFGLASIGAGLSQTEVTDYTNLITQYQNNLL